MNPMNLLNAQERSLIESCPPDGCGVHDWTFAVLKVLVKYYPSDEMLGAAARVIFDHFATRVVDDGEIRRQIGNARRSRCWFSSISCSDLKAADAPGWPLPDIAKIEEIVRSGPGLAQLRGTSPVPTHDGTLGTAQVLGCLFPGDPLVCCSKFIDSHETRALSCWSNLDHYQYIVPSPMSSVWGKTTDGRPSQRTLINTGPRRFLVVEFDFKAASDDGSGKKNGKRHCHAAKHANALEVGRMVSRLNNDGFTVLDMCAALIGHLSQYMPPAMVVYSGGKSLHSWFHCEGVDEDTVRGFMRYAVQLGADLHTWTRNQFVRMPGGLRDNGARQEIVYFNPEALT